MTYLSKIAITIVLGATMALTACALPVGGNMNAQIAAPHPAHRLSDRTAYELPHGIAY